MALNRSKFLNAVAERANAHRRDVEHVWEHALSVIQEAVKKGEDVSISGFGKFKQRVTKARPARVGRNPFTGELQKFKAKPASKKPAFLPAKQFKEVVSGSGKLAKPSTKPVRLAENGARPAAKKAAKKAAPKKARKPARKAAPKKAARKSAKKKTSRRR